MTRPARDLMPVNPGEAHFAPAMAGSARMPEGCEQHRNVPSLEGVAEVVGVESHLAQHVRIHLAQRARVQLAHIHLRVPAAPLQGFEQSDAPVVPKRALARRD